MNITRHISLGDEYIEKLKPYIEKNNGNFGDAIKDLINRANNRNTTINSSIIDLPLFNWILTEIDDKLLPSDILNEFIDPDMINSPDKLERYLNLRFAQLKWDTSVSLKCKADMFPGKISIKVIGDHHKLKFIASMVAQYLVLNSLRQAPLMIRSVSNSSDAIQVELSGSNKKDALRSLETYFAKTDVLINTVKSRPDFWKSLVNRHLLSNYNMVTIHRNFFEDLLAGKVPAAEIAIESLAKKPIKEIPLKEMLNYIKKEFESSRIVDRVEIDKDTLILFHNYRTKEAVESLRKSTAALLDANGHLYDAKSSANILIMSHRSDVGNKINEIVNSLKKSTNKFDQELLIFLGFIKGLKDIPDMHLSLASLGRRTGKSLMQEYEKEHAITHWDLSNFQKALQNIDSRIHRESEWKLDGKDLLYTVRKCNLATENNEFNAYICHTSREVFKGALNYAFGNKAELSIRHLLTHGDKFCEVVIRIH